MVLASSPTYIPRYRRKKMIRSAAPAKQQFSRLYLFNDGIYNGDISTPKTTKLKSLTNLRHALYDRQTGIVWLATDSYIYHYNPETNVLTTVMSHDINSQTDPSAGFWVLKDYIVYRRSSSTSYIYVFNRSWTHLRTISYSTSSYWGTDGSQPYILDRDVIYVGHWYNQTQSYTLSNNSFISNIFGTGYHQAHNFNGKAIIICENGSNNVYIYNSDWTNTRPATGTDMWLCQTTLADSIMVDRMANDKYRGRLIIWATRYATNGYEIDTEDTSFSKSWSSAPYVRWPYVKYDKDRYLFWFDYDQKGSTNYWIYVYNATTGNGNYLSRGDSTRGNHHLGRSLDSNGYIYLRSRWALSINWTTPTQVWKDTTFVACIDCDLDTWVETADTQGGG